METLKPTSDPQAEEQLLSRCFKDTKLLDDGLIMSGVFSIEKHRDLFLLLKILRRAGEQPCSDIVAMRDPALWELATKLEQRPLGGASSAALVDHLETCRQRLGLATLCTEGYDKVMASSNPAGEISVIRAGLDGIHKDSSRLDCESSTAPILRIMENWEWRVTNPGEVRGLRFGRHRCEELIDGLKPGLLYVRGAASSVGKTADMCNDLHYFGEHGIPGHITTMEMTKDELIERLVAIDSGCNILKGSAAGGAFTESDMTSIQRSLVKLGRWSHLHWLDRYRLNIEDWAESVRAAKSRHDIQFAYLDYIQCLAESPNGGDSRAQQTSHAAYMGKEIAKELKIPVVFLCQLRRGEGRYDPKTQRTIMPWPNISQLKESGDIENAADVVELLHRDREEDPRTLWRIIAKQRNGEAYKKFKHSYREYCYQIEEEAYGG